MKISVFGATGMAGSQIVVEALARGHAVTGVARTTSHLPTSERLSTMSVDVGAAGTLDPALSGFDAAVLTIRPAPGAENMLAPWTKGFLEVAARNGTRVIVIGGAGPLRSPSDPVRFVIDDPDYVPAPWRGIAQASFDQLDVCQRHPYTGWTYLSPPAIFSPGPRTGRYRRGTTTLLTDADGISRITAADLAIAVIDEIESPGGDPHFTVAEVPVTEASVA